MQKTLSYLGYKAHSLYECNPGRYRYNSRDGTILLHMGGAGASFLTMGH